MRAPDQSWATGARLLVLGLNASVVGVLLPLVLAGTNPVMAFAWSAVPIAALTIGVSSRARWPRVSLWALLFATPIATGVALVVGSSQVRTEVHESASLVVAALSYAAYLVGALAVCSMGAATGRVQVAPMAAPSLPSNAASHRSAQRLLLLLGGTGAFAVAVVAPVVGLGLDVRASGPGSSATQALAAVVGGGLGALILAAYIGPAFRGRVREVGRLPRTRWRTASLLFAAVLATLSWTVLRFVTSHS